MAALLSLFAALLFGVADFTGGMASKRVHVLEVVAGAHLIGLIGLLAVTPALADVFTWGDLGLGAAGGALGGIGLLLLYRRLAEGPMQVVAPLTAVTSAVVPALWDLSTGGTLDSLELGGLGLALVAVWLVSLSDSGDEGDTSAVVTPAVVVESCLAGAGFGGLFIFLDAADAASAPWPVVGARLLTVTVFFALAARRLARDTNAAPRPIGERFERSTIWFIAAAGLLDTAANVAFLEATGRGQLSLVAVLAALYPVATATLAWLVLGERLRLVQYVGFAAALVASILIAL